MNVVTVLYLLAKDPSRPPDETDVPKFLLDVTLVGHSSSHVVTMKIPYGVAVLSHGPALHPIFSYWVGQN